MTDPPHYPDSQPYMTPRWVKVFGIIAVVVVLLFLVALLVPGTHGPGRHMRGGPKPPVQLDVRQP